MEETGFEICPIWLKKKYREACNFICTECHRHESEVGSLTPHRIKRGNQGGLYTLFPLNHKLSNIKVVCNDCHKRFHSNEFNNVRSK